MKKLWYHDLFNKEYIPPPTPDVDVVIQGPDHLDPGESGTFSVEIESYPYSPIITSIKWYKRYPQMEPFIYVGHGPSITLSFTSDTPPIDYYGFVKVKVHYHLYVDGTAINVKHVYVPH